MNRKKFAVIITAFLLSLPFWAVRYNINFVNGEEVTTEKLRYYEALRKLPEAKKDYYDFEGWFLNDERVEELEHVLGNKDLEARYSPKTYSITYDTDESVEGLPKSYTYGEELSLPELKKENYDFIGYNLNGKTIKSISSQIHNNIVLSPVFEPKTYSISYGLNGGYLNSDDIDSYTYGSPIELPNASLKGYSFLGWYLDENLTEKFNFSEETSGDLILYAGYKEIPKLQGGYSVERNLSKPYVVCGSYAASLVGTSNFDEAVIQSIVDGAGAFWDFPGGVEYIADHNYQGASAFTYNNTLAIVRGDDTIDYYTKTGHVVYSFDNMPKSSDIAGMAVSLVTQTCVGSNVYMYQWAKQ